MSDWNPALPLPWQLADAFAALYDWFEANHFEDADDQLWDERARRDPETKALIASVAASSEGTPARVVAALERAQAGRGEVAYAIYRNLYAIDRGIERQHPLHASGRRGTPGVTLLEHYDRFARYNTDEIDGYVLPKWTTRYRGTAFAEHFKHLVRARVDRNRIRVIGRNPRAFTRRGVRNPRVAVVPFLYSLFDDPPNASVEAVFSGIDVGAQPCFQVLHQVGELPNLERRIRRAVEAIRAASVTIAVFPELVLDERLLRVLRDHLKETDGADTALDWVVAGVAMPSTPPSRWPIANLAYVLDSGGNPVAFPLADATHWTWVQAKRHRYKLTRKEQDRYGVSGGFAEERDRLEAISVGRHHVVFDDRSGRYAVLICEDLAQEERTLDQLRRLLCRLIVVIVMDGPVEEGRWAGLKAGAVVTQTGGFAVVANSLLLPNSPPIRRYRAEKKEIPDPWPDGEQPVGLLIDPRDDDEPRFVRLYARTTPDAMDGMSLLSSREDVPFVPPYPPLPFPTWPPAPRR